MNDAEWIKYCTKKISTAIGGGSELFVRHGDDFRLDVDFVVQRIQEMRESKDKALRRLILTERRAND